MKNKFIILMAIMCMLNLNVLAIDITGCGVLDNAGSTYYLTQNITNHWLVAANSTCINIAGENIILDCQGYTIDGQDQSGKTAIFLGVNGTTLRNCVVTDWYDAIDITTDSNNNVITNVTVGSSRINIMLDGSSYNTFSDITTYSGAMSAIYLDTHSNYNTISDINVIGNGIRLIDSSNYNIITNVTGGDIRLDNASYNTFSDISTKEEIKGVFLEHGSMYNNFTNINTSGYTNYGVQITESPHNIFTNITANSNMYGFVMRAGSDTTIKNSAIENNTRYGINVGLDDIGLGQNNLIYNNFFNNTNSSSYPGNIEFADTTAGTWNINKQVGVRIYSEGPQIGGNFWANYEGNGYSETCVDANIDGFCDVQFDLTTNNIDYLPYSVNGSVSYPPEITYHYPTNNSIIQMTDLLYLIVNVDDDDNDLLDININYLDDNYGHWFYDKNYSEYSCPTDYRALWSPPLTPGKIYNWTCNVTDGIHTTTETYFFTVSNYSSTCMLSGRITDINTLSPIWGVSIHIYLNDSWIATDTSNFVGLYSFPNLICGETYAIYATELGYTPYEKDVDVVQESTLWSFSMTPQILKYGIQYTYKDIDSNDDINNFSLIFENSELGTYLEIINTTEIIRYGCSYNIIGNWINVYNLTPGSYDVIHGAYGYFDYPMLDNIGENTYDQTIYLQNISLMGDYNITGWVKCNDIFLENIRVKLLKSPNYNIYQTVLTDSNGKYNFTDIPKENYIVEIYDGMYNPYISGIFNLIENKEINISLTIPTDHIKVDGHITFCGGYESFIMDNVKVDFIDSLNRSYIAYTDNTGYYTIYVPEGIYLINLSKTGFYFRMEDMSWDIYWEKTIDLCMDKSDSYNYITISTQYNYTVNDTFHSGFLGDVEIKIYRDSDNILIGELTTNEWGSGYIVLPSDTYTFHPIISGYYTDDITKIIDSDDEIIFYFDLEGDFSKLLDDIGLPQTEKAVWNWLNKNVWTLLFIILLLFISVIILNLLVEGKDKLSRLKK